MQRAGTQLLLIFAFLSCDCPFVKDVVWCVVDCIRSGRGGRPNSTRKLETLDGSLDDGMDRGREACRSI